MNAQDILDMTLDEFIQYETGWEAEPASPYTEEVEIGPVGSYFDNSFGNYLPSDPPTAAVEVYGSAMVNLVCNGVPYACCDWELPEDYFYENIESDDEGGFYVNGIDDLVQYAVEDMMAEGDDAGIYLADGYYEPDMLLDYFGDSRMTVRRALEHSEMFSPLG